MKKVIVLGGGGFIGGHLAKKLKENGAYVRICDIKKHEYFDHQEICNEFILGDLTNPKTVELVIGQAMTKCINWLLTWAVQVTFLQDKMMQTSCIIPH